MFKNIKEKLGRFFANDYIESVENRILNKEKEIETTINNRVALIVSNLDAIDLLMKDYNGVFSSDFTNPEDKLNDQGKLGMYMYGWQQKNDPYFEHMINFIMDSAGNQTMKGKIMSEEDLKKKMLYGRAQIANMILLRKQVGRLASVYEDILDKKRGGGGFDSSSAGEV